jgi:hypothetical protein
MSRTGVLEVYEATFNRPRIFYSQLVAEDLVKRGLAVRISRRVIQRLANPVPVDARKSPVRPSVDLR